MSDVSLHQHYLHYSELPYSIRVLYTAALLVLGLGYLFALIYLYHTYAGRAGGNPAFLAYQDLVVAYTGTDIFTLVRVSHIHLFGITFIFFIVGLIFSHAYMRPVWLKCTVIVLPYVCLATDISSWYLVKLSHPFAWVTMGAGALMGVS